MDPLADRIRALDTAVEKRLQPHRSRALDRLCYGISSVADHGLLWHALGVLRALRRGDAGYSLRFSRMLGIESAVTNLIVKSLFARVRPPEHFANDDPLPYGMRRPVTTSFPSGHAATAFMCAVLLSKGSRAGSCYFALATLVSASRVYTRMHHTSDVVAGAALGLALGGAVRSRF